MEDKIKIEDLPVEQQKYVKEYQRILHGLADVQESIKALQDKARGLTEELNTLRAKEKAEFGEDTIL